MRFLQSRRAVGALVFLLSSLGFLACGDAESSADGGAGEPAEGAFRAALLTQGPVSDAGWYAGGYAGLLAVRDSLGAQVSHQQTRTPSEYDEAFLAYASDGYDLIFAHGSEYQEAALRAGARYPELMIVVSGAGRAAANVVPIIFELEKASYLAGMMAGGMTESGVVGMVGGMATPPAQGTFVAFEAGVKSVAPEATVLEAFIGSWDDVAAAKEAAVSQIARGADILIHNTDGASFGIFQAVREARDAGDQTWAMGMNRDQNDVAPEVILGSAVIHIERGFLAIARAWQAGEIGGEPWYAGTVAKVVEFVPNPAVIDQIPEDLLARIDRARRAILDGSLQVPRVPFVDGESGVGGQEMDSAAGPGPRAGADSDGD